MQEVATQISNENSYLSTAYRFTNSRFQNHITPERVERIIEISPSDYSLSPEQIRSKKNGVDVEFEMSHNSQWDETWINRQVAIARIFRYFERTFSEIR